MAAIAFIGLGQMGSPMASNLLQQGHQLRVFDVNAEAVRHPGRQRRDSRRQPGAGRKMPIYPLPCCRMAIWCAAVLFGERRLQLIYPMRWSLICRPSIRCKPIN